MAAQYCMKCGAALPPGAAFCAHCGSAVSGLPAGSPAAPTGGSTPGAFPAVPPTLPQPSLGAALGLEGKRRFLVQHQLLSMGHSYRVMDPEKNHLFTIQGNVGQNLTSDAWGSLLGGTSSYLGRMAARSVEMTYALVDARGTPLGSILKQGGANRSTFTLMDSRGQPSVTVNLERGLMGGVRAQAVAPDGRPILETGGNLVRHNFMIKDSAGRDVAKVHEDWVTVRDTYGVDLLGSIDPLYPLVFTILLDFEKVK